MNQVKQQTFFDNTHIPGENGNIHKAKYGGHPNEEDAECGHMHYLIKSEKTRFYKKNKYLK